MTAILREEPKPLTERRPEAPPLVRRLLERYLAKPADARFQSGRERLLVLEIAGTGSMLPQASGVVEEVHGSAPRRATLGSVVFVAALARHPFCDISEDLTTLVFFAPAETE